MINATFMEALAAMQNGQAVKRDKWTILDGYRMVLPGTKHIYAVVNAHVQPNVQWAPITIEDFNANDWRLLNADDVTPPAPVPAPCEHANQAVAA